jgi:hypothetical protein
VAGAVASAGAPSGSMPGQAEQSSPLVFIATVQGGAAGRGGAVGQGAVGKGGAVGAQP